MNQSYPVSDPDKIDENSVQEMEWCMTLILGVRRVRGEMNIAPGKPLPVLIENGSEQDKKWLDNNRELLQKIGRLEKIDWLTAEDTAPESFVDKAPQAVVEKERRKLDEIKSSLLKFEEQRLKIEKL